jgi:predicted nucleic acid-binding protein
MKLVVDTNVLFSFFKKESETRRLILNFEILELVTPSFCIDELNEHKELICKKSRLSDSEFEEVLDDLLIFVKVFSLSEYKDFLSDAKIISPDPDDIDLFALALKLNCPIWAQEKGFKKQPKVQVFSTSDLISLLFSNATPKIR